ncbi:MAG TPA: autotransporter domain-containing protein [Candidatus Methylacidiphilales bacterium]|nr:autotransporter domain-containing protein [Candidatus Methylacidiphilales bacterium]
MASLIACATHAKAVPNASPQYAVNGTTVTGSGTNTTSAYFTSTTSAAYTITVTSGANLGNTTQDQIDINNGSITNSGALSSSDYAVVIGGTGSVNGSVANTATGSITATTGSGIFFNENNPGTTENSNSVSATNAGTISGLYGIGADATNTADTGSGTNSNTVTLGNTGSITGTSSGIYIFEVLNQTSSGSASTNSIGLTNSGTISTTDIDGVRIVTVANSQNTTDSNTNTVTLTNSAGGTISGSSSGVYVVSISNAKNNDAATNANTVTLTNAGTINSTDGLGITLSAVYNANNGSGSNTNTVTINNSGAITVAEAGIVINPSVNTDDGVNNQGNAGGGTNTVSITNSGTITATNENGIFVAGIFNNANAGGSEDTFTNTVTLSNSGTINSANSTSIEVENGIYNLDNTGPGASANTVTILNANNASISGESGIYISGIANSNNGGSGANTVTVTNNGSITATDGTGIDLPFISNNSNTNGSGTNTVTVMNTGAINADDQAFNAAISNTGNDGTGPNSNAVSFTNTGSLVATANDAVDLSASNSNSAGNASNTVAFINGGVINGEDGVGVNISNGNTTTAGNSLNTISFTNSGSVTGTANAVSLTNADSGVTGTSTNTITVVNSSSGRMVGGTGSDGLDITNPTTVATDTASVTNAGVIQGGTDGIALNSNNAAVKTSGGAIIGGADAIDLNGNNSSVTILGRTNVQGVIEGNGDTGNTLTFDIAGMTPGQIAAAQAAIAAANGGPGTFTAGAYAYNFDGFLAGNIVLHAVSFEQSVDSGLQNLATKLDTGNVPISLDLIYDKGFSNPEATLNNVSGREFLDAFTQIGLNNATAFSQLAENRANDLRSGSSGLNFSGLNLTPRSMIASLGQTENVLNRLAAPSLLGGTSFSDSKEMTEVQPAPSSQPWGVWVSGTVTFADESGTGSAPGYNATSGSPTIGLDYRVCQDLVLGGLFNYTTAGVDFDDGSSLDADVYLGGLYADWAHDHWFINALAGGAYSSYSQERNTLSGATATASPTGDEALATLAGGYDFKVAGWIISPEVGLQYTHLTKDSFSENGAGAFDLNVGSQNVDSLRTKLGFNIIRPFEVMGVKCTPQIHAFWYHECLDDTQNVSNSLSGAPAIGSFVVTTNEEGRDFALAGAGFDATPANWDGNVSFFANYDAQVGQSDFLSNTVDGGVRVDF